MLFWQLDCSLYYVKPDLQKSQLACHMLVDKELLESFFPENNNDFVLIKSLLQYKILKCNLLHTENCPTQLDLFSVFEISFLWDVRNRYEET